MIQASTQENREQFSAVQRILNERGPDHYVVEAHSEHAERELSLLLKQRSLTPDRVRQALITLAQRVTDGDLRYVERSIRAKVQYWSARLHALQPETLPIARHYLVQLHQTDPGADTRIIDALILEAEGNIDGLSRCCAILILQTEGRRSSRRCSGRVVQRRRCRGSTISQDAIMRAS